MSLSRFVIPAKDTLDVKVRPRFSLGDIFRGKVRFGWWVLKLDWMDFFPALEIHRKSGPFKYLRFTPDNPERFVAAWKSITEFQGHQS